MRLFTGRRVATILALLGCWLLAGTRTIASVTVTGDRWCRSTHTTYRLDAPFARDFLDDFVTVP